MTVAVRGWNAGGEVVIRDTGKGLSRDLLARLGASFFTTREGGTGLGVVLARAAVHQHGGEMHYASEVGRGTTVTIRLPAVPTRLPSATVAEQAA